MLTRSRVKCMRFLCEIFAWLCRQHKRKKWAKISIWMQSIFRFTKWNNKIRLQYIPMSDMVSGKPDAQRTDKMTIVACPHSIMKQCNVRKVNHSNLSCFDDLPVIPDTGIIAKICPKNSTRSKTAKTRYYSCTRIYSQEKVVEKNVWFYPESLRCVMLFHDFPSSPLYHWGSEHVSALIDLEMKFNNKLLHYNRHCGFTLFRLAHCNRL